MKSVIITLQNQNENLISLFYFCPLFIWSFFSSIIGDFVFGLFPFYHLRISYIHTYNVFDQTIPNSLPSHFPHPSTRFYLKFICSLFRSHRILLVLSIRSRCRTIYRIKGSLLGSASLKKTDFPSPSNH